MQEDRACRSVGRLGRKRIVRDEDQFLSDLGVTQALSAWIPRVLICDIDRAATAAQLVGDGRIDSNDDELGSGHVAQCAPLIAVALADFGHGVGMESERSAFRTV